MNNNSKISTEDEAKQVALFKFSLIAPLVNNCHAFSSQSAYFRDIASKKHIFPSGKEVYFSAATIRNWYFWYKRNGFDALIPKSRSDIGISRVLPFASIDRIKELKLQFPHITGKAIYKKLIEEGSINAKDVSINSVYRYLKANNLKYLPTVERKAFEMEFANDCWQRRFQLWSCY